MNKSVISVIVVTFFLVGYITWFQLWGPGPIVAFLFFLSPLLIALMVYVVLTDKTDYPELPEHQEWGYRDKPGYK